MPSRGVFRTQSQKRSIVDAWLGSKYASVSFEGKHLLNANKNKTKATSMNFVVVFLLLTLNICLPNRLKVNKENEDRCVGVINVFKISNNKEVIVAFMVRPLNIS